jgi:hypothetical protein
MKKFTTLMAASLALSMLIVAPVGANSRSASNSQRQVSWAEVVQEQTQGDAPEVTRTPVGWSRLVRTVTSEVQHESCSHPRSLI